MGFKALKQTVKLHFKLANHEAMMASYRKLLTYVKSAVTRNYSEKVIHSILDAVGASPDVELLQEFYQTTLEALAEARNDRLWFKTNLKLCKMFFSLKEFPRVSKILRELYAFCRNEDGSANHGARHAAAGGVRHRDPDVHGAEEQQEAEGAVPARARGDERDPHPYILGIIRECGGKMHMAERNWNAAATDFFESFKDYDEAGQPRRVRSLKYLVLANMLMESNVNPFDAQEARPFRTDPEVVAITSLVAAYQRNDIERFEELLDLNRKQIMEDAFVRDYVEDLLKNIRTQVLMRVIKPYTRVGIPFIAGELKIPEKDVEALLVSLILDARIRAYRPAEQRG